MINPENIYHVLPTNDLHEHVECCLFPIEGAPHCDCSCHPQHKEVENEGLIIIHNSFDGREIIEQFKNNHYEN